MPADTPMPGMPLPPDQVQAPIASPGVQPPSEPRLPHWLALRNLKADVADLALQHHANAAAEAKAHLDQVRQRQQGTTADPEFEQALENFKTRMFAYRDAHRRLQAQSVAPPAARDQPGGDALPRFGGVPGITVDYAARPDCAAF